MAMCMKELRFTSKCKRNACMLCIHTHLFCPQQLIIHVIIIVAVTSCGCFIVCAIAAAAAAAAITTAANSACGRGLRGGMQLHMPQVALVPLLPQAYAL